MHDIQGRTLELMKSDAGVWRLPSLSLTPAPVPTNSMPMSHTTYLSLLCFNTAPADAQGC
jgi:hypothetical protein